MATNKNPVDPVNKKSANAALRSAQTWNTIEWNYHRMIVKKLQLRIAKATQEKKFRKVKSLQWILTHSFTSETGHPNIGWLTTGLSRMMRKYHVRFLGGERVATPLATR